MSRITIHSDGTPQGTVVLTESGEKIERIKDISIFVSPDGVAATLDLSYVSMNINAGLTEVMFTCPSCSESFEHRCGKGTVSTNTCRSEYPHATLAAGPSECVLPFSHTNFHFDGRHAWP